ncbi:Enhanced entry protein EnhB [Legionella beliardensis]|uniref:Enhanced entry protein EnhB n=1 Tax=Legionella beliardensis TaxID=91822 RepID=A0A378I390_9GAMM|nr:enhanced entry protein EnhB [Legionella beliardensis]STX29161.1 Enhanced entry protein EnhB [Legionella beliardensis]
MFKKSSLFPLFLLANTLAYAGFPRGCEVTGFGYNGTNLVVNDKGGQTFYLLQNRSNRPIELRRIETQEVFMSPSLTAKIEPTNWAAFASDVENLHFQCFYMEESNNTLVDCREVLDICQYPRVKFALSNMGNYWVSVNKSQRNVINDATAKGIYLRW